MTWARLDDGYDDHPKVMAATHADPLAVALHTQAITASARRESNGLVDPYWLMGKAPNKRKREAALELLTGLRLYDVLPAGEARVLVDEKGYRVTVGPFDELRYLVHDYLDYNPSSAQLAVRRAKDAERKAAGRAADSDGSPAGVRADTDGTPGGSGAASLAPAGPRPVPTRPVNPSPQPSGEGEGGEWSEDVQRLAALFAELRRSNDPKAKVTPKAKGWLDPFRLLLDRDGRTAAEVERVLRWTQGDEFERTVVLSPGKLRKRFDGLKLKMDGAGLRQHMVRNGAPPPSSSAIAAAMEKRPPADRASRTGVRL